MGVGCAVNMIYNCIRFASFQVEILKKQESLMHLKGLSKRSEAILYLHRVRIQIIIRDIQNNNTGSTNSIGIILHLFNPLKSKFFQLISA